MRTFYCTLFFQRSPTEGFDVLKVLANRFSWLTLGVSGWRFTNLIGPAQNSPHRRTVPFGLNRLKSKAGKGFTPISLPSEFPAIPPLYRGGAMSDPA